MNIKQIFIRYFNICCSLLHVSWFYLCLSYRLRLVRNVFLREKGYFFIADGLKLLFKDSLQIPFSPQLSHFGARAVQT